jgi:hypothetical protein
MARPAASLSLLLFVLAPLPAASAFQSDPPPAAPAAAVDDAPLPGDVTDFRVGTVAGLAESSYLHQPQIERLMTDPYPLIVPIHKLPIPEGERPEDRGFRPRPRQYVPFDGVGFTGWVPPDCTLAVGPNHVLQTVNMQVAWYDKATGALQFSVPLNDTGNPGFFETVGAQGFTFDPKCLYDDRAGRFVVLALEVYGSTEAWIDIAVSDDNDPNGTWYKYRTDAVVWNGAQSYWVDYPGLGYDDGCYYVTGNLFGLNAGGWGGVLYRIFKKTPLLSGNPAVWADLQDTGSGSVQVAECHTVPQSPLFVSLSSSTAIKIQAIRQPQTNPSLTTTTVAVPAFASPPAAPDVTGGLLDTLDGRIINVEFRDNTLLAGHGVDTGGGKAVARWYEFATNNWPAHGTSVTLSQSGDVDMGGGVYTWYPALCKNANGEIGLVMAYSSANEYAGIAVAAHKPADAAGAVSMIERVKEGAAGAGGRWGDFFDCCVDPSDATRFWCVGEYPNWGTWLTDFTATPNLPTKGMLYSTRAANSTGGIYYESGDVIHLDTTTGLHTMYLDLSDVTAGPANVDALAHLSDGSLLLSFVASERLPGLTNGPNGNLVDDEDIVRFVPTSLGEVTAGTWDFYFDGSDVGLDTQEEDVDALALDANGNLLISLMGPWDVGGGLTGKDEDILLFTPTSTGAITAGTWSLWFNGRDPDVRLGSPGEDVDALDFDPATNKLLLSTVGDFLVPVNIRGHNHDLLEFTATQFGSDTNGTFALVFTGANYGLATADIDALDILR